MKNNPVQEFIDERQQRLNSNGTNDRLKKAADAFNVESNKAQYSYNFSWMGRPIIQYPQDMVAMQEIIWTVKPDLIIETGIAHGGSLIYYASLLELIGNFFYFIYHRTVNRRTLHHFNPLKHRVRFDLSPIMFSDININP